jgi:quinol monooxygenase YgiN
MTLRWSVSPAESRAIATVLQGLMAATRSEPGCLGCSFSSEMGAHVVLSYVEQWHTECDLIRNLRSERFSILAELMEGASRRPDVEFVLPAATRGLDYAEEVREDGRAH